MVLVTTIRRASGLARPATSTLYAQNGIAFVTNFLTEQTFEKVKEDCRSLRGGFKLERDSIAVGRMGRYVDSRSVAHELLTASAMCDRMNRLIGGPPFVPSEYPIELRNYRVGSAMDWHIDDQLYDIPQCELVLCIDNSSDSHTEWIDCNGERHQEWTPPNSALLVRAGELGAKHRVQPLKRGERTILKMVWAHPESRRSDDFYTHLDSLPGLRGKQRPQWGGDQGRLNPKRAAPGGRKGRKDKR